MWVFDMSTHGERRSDARGGCRVLIVGEERRASVKFPPAESPPTMIFLNPSSWVRYLYALMDSFSAVG